MGDFVTLDQDRYINEDFLVTLMVKKCVEFTNVKDVCVEGAEADLVRAYQELLQDEKIPKSLLVKFQNKYVRERFFSRTI